MAILSACPGMFYAVKKLMNKWTTWFRVLFCYQNDFSYDFLVCIFRIPFEGKTIDKEVEILQVAMGIAPDTQGEAHRTSSVIPSPPTAESTETFY